MYEIDIFESADMPIDWYVVYWGIKNNILSVGTAQEYACRKIEQDEAVSEEESELSWKSDDCAGVLEAIEKIPGFYQDFDGHMEEAKEKVRFAIIVYLRKSEKDIPKLLEQIDMVYADFDYPQDMEKFISYMPADGGYNPEGHSIEENRNRLLNKLDSYIQEQKEKFYGA